MLEDGRAVGKADARQHVAQRNELAETQAHALVLAELGADAGVRKPELRDGLADQIEQERHVLVGQHSFDWRGLAHALFGLAVDNDDRLAR